MGKVQLMTKSEYARHRGVSAVAVHYAVQEGRISLIDGKIDAAVADIQWQRNTRARAPNRPAPESDSPAISAAPAASAEPAVTGDDYWVSRARREAAEAHIAEMKRGELEGKLIRADVLRQAWSRKVASARNALLQIPPRLAPVLAAEADMDRVAALLEDELRAGLAELSREQGPEELAS